jgi:hypothetical protein
MPQSVSSPMLLGRMVHTFLPDTGRDRKRGLIKAQ